MIEIFVAKDGCDSNPGTMDKPFATLQRAKAEVRRYKNYSGHKKEPITVFFREGKYYLNNTVVFTPEDSGEAEATVAYMAYNKENVIISGGMELKVSWEKYRDGIMMAKVPDGFYTDQLFIDGERQRMARYPNYNPDENIFGGFAADCISPERAARWKNPKGGIIHALHESLWGSYHYVITGKSIDNVIEYEGGWQDNRPSPMHKEYRYVENIFEELDEPGEWYLDRSENIMYIYPPEGIDLNKARLEGVKLYNLIELRGTESNPIKYIYFMGIEFMHSLRTFMRTREPLLRSDWAIYRGGALLFDGTEHCCIEDCSLNRLGGNAIFVNNYNRGLTVKGCHITDAGATGVMFAGSPMAVRSPLFYRENKSLSIHDIDKTPGPKSNNFPSECVVEDCLINKIGCYEKQTAGVSISMSQDITIRHCSIYDVPRAGINICDGTWGGHVIEYCDVFDTTKESGDHGCFNAWGRDRFWNLNDIDLNQSHKVDGINLPLLDAVRTTVIRSNRWRCDKGWDIDLDDGATNYHIYNNLALSGGLKFREGFYRKAENNILVNDCFQAYLWFKDSQDVVLRNIVFTGYKFTYMSGRWGKEIDYNIQHISHKSDVTPAEILQKDSLRDEHSVVADVMFIDPENGDYRVKENSIAIKMGFHNFDMNNFGVVSQKLKAIAKTPIFPQILDYEYAEKERAKALANGRDNTVYMWLGAKIKNIVGLSEVTATGAPGESGVLVLEVPSGSRAEAIGIRERDVILRFNDTNMNSVTDLMDSTRTKNIWNTAKITFLRKQKEQSILF